MDSLFDPGPGLDNAPAHARSGALRALAASVAIAGLSPRQPTERERAALDGLPRVDAIVDAPGSTLFLIAVGRTEKNDRADASWGVEGPRGDRLQVLRQRLSELGELVLACWGPSLDEPLAVDPLDLEETKLGHNRHWRVSVQRRRSLSSLLR